MIFEKEFWLSIGSRLKAREFEVRETKRSEKKNIYKTKVPEEQRKERKKIDVKRFTDTLALPEILLMAV